MLADTIGYLGAVIVVLSVFLPQVRRLWVVVVGVGLFAVHAVMIGSGPLLVASGGILVWAMWRLVEQRRRGTLYGAVVMSPETPFLVDFIDKHLDDINRHQPGFRAVLPGDTALMLTVDGLPAGAVVGHREGTTLYLHLDYVLPPFRDFAVGKWLFGPGATVFRGLGITHIVTYSESEYHREYLEAVGFVGDGEQYVNELD